MKYPPVKHGSTAIERCDGCGTLLNGSGHHGIADAHGVGRTGWCPHDPNRPKETAPLAAVAAYTEKLVEPKSRGFA